MDVDREAELDLVGGPLEDARVLERARAARTSCAILELAEHHVPRLQGVGGVLRHAIGGAAARRAGRPDCHGRRTCGHTVAERPLPMTRGAGRRRPPRRRSPEGCDRHRRARWLATGSVGAPPHRRRRPGWPTAHVGASRHAPRPRERAWPRVERRATGADGAAAAGELRRTCTATTATADCRARPTCPPLPASRASSSPSRSIRSPSGTSGSTVATSISAQSSTSRGCSVLPSSSQQRSMRSNICRACTARAVELGGLGRELGALLVGGIDQLGAIRGDLQHREVTQVAHDRARELDLVDAALDRRLHRPERRAGIAVGERAHERCGSASDRRRRAPRRRAPR